VATTGGCLGVNSSGTNTCLECGGDRDFLLKKDRPDYERGSTAIRIVDLFSGCGGMTLGAAEGARSLGLATNVVLAVDSDKDAHIVFKRNFPGVHFLQQDMAILFHGALGSRISEVERPIIELAQGIDLLVAGAPCQGHSDLNNHTRRCDPRNSLYLRAIRAVELLRPNFVLLENVPAILHDSSGVLDEAIAVLETHGYRVACSVLKLSNFGVPQTRRRHLLLASKQDSVEPSEILRSIQPRCEHIPRTTRWAIQDLENIKPENRFDTSSVLSKDNVGRIRWLFRNAAYDLPNRLRPICHHGKHSYTSMYGRLDWDKPAQTITTGFGSVGQGRFIHPGERRVITPHEAARIQTLPDFFDFGCVDRRVAMSRLIGNAVPPFLTRAIVACLFQQNGDSAQQPSSLGHALGHSSIKSHSYARH